MVESYHGMCLNYERIDTQLKHNCIHFIVVIKRVPVEEVLVFPKKQFFPLSDKYIEKVHSHLVCCPISIIDDR